MKDRNFRLSRELKRMFVLMRVPTEQRKLFVDADDYYKGKRRQAQSRRGERGTGDAS